MRKKDKFVKPVEVIKSIDEHEDIKSIVFIKK